MWPLTTFTIGFRGLMVIHKVETEEPNYFEIGVLNDPNHSLRLNIIKNGMLAETRFLPRPDPDDPDESRTWAIEVDNPLVHGVSTYTHAPAEFVRKEHADEKDFRWITELEELFPGIENELITDRFTPVLKIYDGIFYTRVKSPRLSKFVSGGEGSGDFGYIAAVVACDIPMLSTGRVRLVEQFADSDPNTLLTLEPDENTIYEFANTPADEGAHPEPHDAMHAAAEDANPDPCRFDHFKSYYTLFPRSSNRPIICFRKADGPPAPDPATCGAVGTGGIKVPFGGGGT